MILVDANLLVYARVSTLPQHAEASAWLDQRPNGVTAVGLPWSSLLAFVRLFTNPRIFERPDTMTGAWRQVEQWLDCRPVWIPQPAERHRALLGSLLPESGAFATRWERSKALFIGSPCHLCDLSLTSLLVR